MAPRRLVFTIAAIITQMAAGTARADENRERELRLRIQPLLQEHCLDCHSGAEPDAGLTLDNFSEPIDFLKGRAVWEHAVQKMTLDEMPPPDSSSLSAADRRYLIDWLTQVIDEFECGLAPNPGKVTLRRLNATEYRNTIRDLFQLPSYKPATAFAGDDVGYGFDNIGDVLTLPPLLMEKYLIEAERISHALIQPPLPPEVWERSLTGGQLRVDATVSNVEREMVLASSGTAKLDEQFPWSGSYSLVVTAGGDQAGNEPCLMMVKFDGQPIQRIVVANDASEPAEFALPLRRVRAGRHTLELEFLNDFYDAARGLDRNLVIHHVLIRGTEPGNTRANSPKPSKYHKRLIPRVPRNDGERERVTRATLFPIASRAFRRVVDDTTMDRLVGLAMDVQSEGGSFEESIQVALQAILVSPHFLFLVEPPRTGDSADESYPELDEFELASRLSYFLWSSMPDDELFQLAARKQLRSGNQLERQIARMLKDKRAEAFVHNFAGQWLTLRKLADFQPDPARFPEWNDRIRRLVEYETKAFFLGVVRNNLSVLELLNADFTYLNEELARFYGIEGVSGSEFRKVSLAGTHRAGLLTHASVLAVTSNPTRTSPVKRGKWILDILLNKPPPPAPALVPELEEVKTGRLSGTLRERLEQHRADPACANCHKLMDPLGFALENFDAVGQYRTADGSLPIDARGELPGGDVVEGAQALRDLLAREYKHQFVECLAEKMLTYALGRGLEYYDKCAVDKIVSEIEADDFRFSALLVGIVRSDPFQRKGTRE